jgi:enoyl-CoA hydratase/carnithine racemase
MAPAQPGPWVGTTLSMMSEMAFKTILYQRRGSTALVTLNRPQVMNALSHETLNELQCAFEAIRTDDQVKGVILLARS